jgi:hypothetical protein
MPELGAEGPHREVGEVVVVVFSRAAGYADGTHDLGPVLDDIAAR